MGKIQDLEDACDLMEQQNSALQSRIKELENIIAENESICNRIQERVREAKDWQIQLIWALDGMERYTEEGTTLCREDWMYTVRDVNKTIMELHSMTMLFGDLKKVE